MKNIFTNIESASESIALCIQKLDAAGINLTDAYITIRLADGSYAMAMASAAEKRIISLGRDALKNKDTLIYSVFEQSSEINAVIRTCPYFCSIVAQKGKDIPPVLDDMAQIVGVYARVWDVRETKKMLKTLKKNYACLTKADSPAGLGAIATGRTLEQAFTATLVLEKSAQVYIEGEYIGGAKPLNRLEAAIMHLGYKLKYSRVSDVAARRSESDFTRKIPEPEMAIRSDIIAIGKQLSRDNLVQGTWGNISVRLDDTYMLSTPSGLDYFSITPYDIVRVEMGTLEYEGNLKPTAEKTFHAGLLKAHPDVQCVIHTHPVNSSIFAAAHRKICPENNAERTLMFGDAELARYGFPSSKQLSKNVVASIRNNRVCVMENHGMLVCGSSINDAYEKCRITEVCARATIDRLKKNI